MKAEGYLKLSTRPHVLNLNLHLGCFYLNTPGTQELVSMCVLFCMFSVFLSFFLSSSSNSLFLEHFE